MSMMTKKYKKLTAAALIIAAVLALSFWYGKTPAVKEQSAGISEITEKTQTDNENVSETKPQNQPEKAEEYLEIWRNENTKN